MIVAKYHNEIFTYVNGAYTWHSIEGALSRYTRIPEGRFRDFVAYTDGEYLI